MRTRPPSITLLVALAACGSDRHERGEVSGDTATDGTAGDTAQDATPAETTPMDSVAPADTTPPDTTPPDTTPPDTTPADTAEPLPNISVALDCGDAPPSGAGNANELQRYQIDTGIFPDALCNNGDAAVFYYRPHVGEDNRNRWLINLNGGGACGGGDSCAARWCWCRSLEGPDGCPFAKETTNFSMANMNGDTRATISGDGIFLRGDADRPNPLGAYNQVRIVYCSSDTWAGTRRDAPFDSVHPKTGEPVAFSIHFLGRRILDAALATLRRDGVPALRYTLSNARDLPDLDDAVELVLSGDSAGGAGVIGNLDRVAALLREHNTGCTGATCPLVVQGLIDAAVGPELARLDFSTSVWAELGGDTYGAYMSYADAASQQNLGTIRDESCREWHRANAPETGYQCGDGSHILRHHLTTPFFVRMALLDQLISDNYISSGYSDPDLGPLTLQSFAVILQRELAAFPELPETAEEGDAMTRAPGVFAPACTKHDTIHDNQEVYRASITPEGGEPLTLFQVFENWRNGVDPRAVLTRMLDRSDTFCPP